MRFARRYLLDTNTIAYLVRDRSAAVRRRSESLPEQSQLLLSAICEAEILSGLEKTGSEKLLMTFGKLAATMDRAPWDETAAKSYADLSRHLRSTGLSLTLMDKLIASHAAALKATLVTHDKALQRLASYLPVEDWATDV